MHLIKWFAVACLSRELQSRLLNMVAGDRATARRLVDNARASNPGCPESWYWEKAIDDLIPWPTLTKPAGASRGPCWQKAYPKSYPEERIFQIVG